SRRDDSAALPSGVAEARRERGRAVRYSPCALGRFVTVRKIEPARAGESVGIGSPRLSEMIRFPATTASASSLFHKRTQSSAVAPATTSTAVAFTKTRNERLISWAPPAGRTASAASTGTQPRQGCPERV